MFRAELASALLFLVEVFSGLATLAGIGMFGYASLLPVWDAAVLVLATILSFGGLLILAAVQVGKAIVHIATTNDQILDALLGTPEDEVDPPTGA